MNKSKIFVIIAFLTLSLAAFSFNFSLYSQMAMDQKVLVTSDITNWLLLSIFFLLLALYFKKHD